MRKLLITIIAFTFFQGVVYAQTTVASSAWDSPVVLFYVTIGVVVVLSLLVLAVALYMLRILKTLTREVAVERAKQQNVAFEEKPGGWAVFNQWLTRSTPIEKEETIMFDHSYDGIRELDNHLPPWWKALLYGSIIWGALYLFVYHVSDSFPLSAEEYDNELAYAEAQLQQPQEGGQQAQIDENTVTLVTDAAALQDGEKTFLNLCASCHLPDGGGDIGPNLTDAYWKHGGSIEDLYKVVVNGVTGTNMIAWSAALSPEKIQNVTSYVLTLQGTSPANAKAPEGELYEPDNQAAQTEEGAETTEDTPPAVED